MDDSQSTEAQTDDEQTADQQSANQQSAGQATENQPSAQPASRQLGALLQGAAPQGRPLVVVGIGGSAGALDGYERFFLSLPVDSGMAFVVVPHLDPRHRGLMPEILQRCTSMPVAQVGDGVRVQPDHVYVIPPGHSLSIMNGTLLLEDLELAQGRVIDSFFESLARDQGENAVGVILSGMGSDGTRGIQAIKESFGLALVQDPASAEYPSMPRSAAATGLANDVLPAEDLAPRLYSFVTRSRSLHAQDFMDEDGRPSAPLQKILRLVRVRTGHDFTRYKRSTLVRRIDRRMKAHRTEDISDYLRLLQDSKDEVDGLFSDFTINVTSFFRDVDAFDELKAQLRRTILTHKQDLENMRVWVAGCSTGEEAYSVAMVLHELGEELAGERAFKVQLFATDIDKEALDRARYGLYPRDISYVVSPARLERYFQLHEGGYQVRPEIRNMVVFAQHNTYGDPPFTRLDLLCCRNMLIYLSAELQAQIMSVFQYALRPGGLLFLGASETAGTERDAFHALDARWKIYARGDGPPAPLTLEHSVAGAGAGLRRETGWSRLPAQQSSHPGALMQQAQTTLLAHYAPPSVVINPDGEILLVNGPTGHYLELPLGKTLTNAFEMVRDGLRYELPAAVQQALTEGGEVVRPNLRVETGPRTRVIDLIVRPLPGAQPHLLVLFREHGGESEGPPPERTDQVRLMERELQRSRESLQANIEDMAVSVEELRSTNEELQTSNEELQSSNEELTTSKEELQSLNEELITINAEHQRVIYELAQANNDMKNLLDSAGIATVFLGNDLTIKRFTPRITRVINLMTVDLGRPITDISANLRYENLTRDISRVLETLETLEIQVQTHGGQWYLMRISPYRTADNFIDGVVVAFTNVDVIKGMERQMRDALAYAEGVLNSMQDPLLVLDAGARVVSANRALHHLLQMGAQQVNGADLYALAHGVFDQPELRARLGEVIASGQPLSNFVIDLNVPQHGARRMKTEANPVSGHDGQYALTLFKMEDVTEVLHRAATEGEDFGG
ncbi:CheR family methyltransferase [Deinococcus marmoris]|uniref:CheR family methyltransferase n=1 Tax=Deinococcus marmoris TaxID=249408 RepID=UPI0009DE2BB1|nr:CheR family methyltransferase [Deinococcus marmoris]